LGDARSADRRDLFNQKIDGTAWRSPSWYIVANRDRTVQPELQRFVANRMAATIVEVASSHVPMLSGSGPRARRDPQGGESVQKTEVA
jgi:hypothetical protein